MRIKFSLDINVTGSIVRTPKKPVAAAAAAPAPYAPGTIIMPPGFDIYSNSAESDNG